MHALLHKTRIYIVYFVLILSQNGLLVMVPLQDDALATRNNVHFY
jgi:hypothetical protein